MELFEGEPAAGPWRVEPIAAVLAGLERGSVVLVDGRSAGGKSTCAGRLAATVPGAVVVHTDDVAWWVSFFDWAHLLRDGILEPFRAGEQIGYTPPGWAPRGRTGAIEVPAGCPLLVVEGVGVSRQELSGYGDLRLWMQSDRVEARRRGLERDGDTVEFWEEWDAEEIPFLRADRPWERAHLIVAGTPEVPYDRETELVVADPPTAR